MGWGASPYISQRHLVPGASSCSLKQSAFMGKGSFLSNGSETNYVHAYISMYKHTHTHRGGIRQIKC